MPGLLNPKASSRQLLKQTISRCPVCQVVCPGEIWRVDGQPAKVFLNRQCPIHGETSVCLASDARFYWLAEDKACGCGDSACCAADGSRAGTAGRNAADKGAVPFAALNTCVALIEIVNSCNLSCPVCFVDSPRGANGQIQAVPRPELQQRIQNIIDQKGRIEVLQFSGGEPTLHPELFELLAWAQAHPGIKNVLLNTNGLRLAREPDFPARLKALFPCERLHIYLQFDGLQAAGQHWLRGADLRDLRRQAIERCAAANLPLTLALTVTPHTLPHLWETIEFGLKYPSIHGIVFQPLFGSGRVPKADNAGPCQPITTADIILAAVQQSSGKLRCEDFTPLPCGDPNCAVIGYLLRIDQRTFSFSDFLNFSRLKSFLRDKVNFTLQDLARCSCEDERLGALLKQKALHESMTFRLMIKPFMDAWTWDESRVESCCTHVIRPDGKLDSFCRYYSGFPDNRAAP